MGLKQITQFANERIGPGLMVYDYRRNENVDIII